MIRISLKTLLLVSKTTSKFPGCVAEKSNGISLTRRRTNLPWIKSDFRSDRINITWLFSLFVTFTKPETREKCKKLIKFCVCHEIHTFNIQLTSCEKDKSRNKKRNVEQKISKSCTLQCFSHTHTHTHTHTENQLQHSGQNQRRPSCGGRVEVCCVCVAVESPCVILLPTLRITPTLNVSSASSLSWAARFVPAQWRNRETAGTGSGRNDSS